MQDELALDESNVNESKIEAPEADYLYIHPSQLIGAGQGLYTAITIHKDEVIALFDGEVITFAEADIRAELGIDQYLISQLDGNVMDSMHADCFAKFANDAQGFTKSNFRNNARIMHDEEDNICLIASRKIKAGEEIFCAYGKKYWKKQMERMKEADIT
ncbi:MAG: SET domain-containing protein-lysine N-methyltransferase [Bacteroidetes bacterium]|nr:SET domain-containing protein-lysine N-methyltransferase [Bacteroidota bacterium]